MNAQRTPCRRGRGRGRGGGGFTLIGFLVALFITAILFAMGYGAVNQALNTRKGLEDQQARLLAVQTTMRVLAQDFGQLAPRPVHQPVGGGYLPALQADPTIQPFAILTRDGWANPAGIQRPALQRVAYFLDNGTLRREYWPVLDAMLSTTTRRRELLSGVHKVAFRYMDTTQQWRDQWPPLGVPGAAPPPQQQQQQQQQQVTGAPIIGLTGMERMRPIAVQVILELDDWGTITRTFEVPT